MLGREGRGLIGFLIASWSCWKEREEEGEKGWCGEERTWRADGTVRGRDEGRSVSKSVPY